MLDPGIVINPLQLKRITQGGTVQGISEALKEAVAFDKAITSNDWVTYPIVRFTTSRTSTSSSSTVGPERPRRRRGLERAPLVAIPAAFFDATGKLARTLPLRPANVRALLKA